MENSDSANAVEANQATRFRSMQKGELEGLAVSAILEHRRLLAADEAIYEEWVRSTADPMTQVDLVRSLQLEYLKRQRKSGAQQEELSEILDALGYIPPVPSKAVE